MSSGMLLELSVLFSIEALERDVEGDADEADRLWDISEELFDKHASARVREQRAEDQIRLEGP